MQQLWWGVLVPDKNWKQREFFIGDKCREYKLLLLHLTWGHRVVVQKPVSGTWSGACRTSRLEGRVWTPVNCLWPVVLLAFTIFTCSWEIFASFLDLGIFVIIVICRLQTTQVFSWRLEMWSHDSQKYCMTSKGNWEAFSFISCLENSVFFCGIASICIWLKKKKATQTCSWEAALIEIVNFCHCVRWCDCQSWLLCRLTPLSRKPGQSREGTTIWTCLSLSRRRCCFTAVYISGG